MTTNRILNLILCIFSFVIIPVQIISTFVLGLAVSFTCGLLLVPISFIWLLLFLPMVAISWLCNKAPALRDVIGIILIPWAVIADTFVALTPSMGEIEGRAAKMMLCESWPFTWDFLRFLMRRVDLESDDPNTIALKEIVTRMASNNPYAQRVLMRVLAGQQLDPLMFSHNQMVQ